MSEDIDHHGIKALESVEKLTKIGAKATLVLVGEYLKFEYSGINFRFKRVN